MNVVQIWYPQPVMHAQANPFARGDDPRARLREAARRRAAIDDPHLLRAQVAGTASGDARLKLEKLDAPALAQLLGGRGMASKRAVTMLAGLARAVATLEGNGLVVRDVVPERVLLDDTRGAVLAEHGMPPELVPLSRPEPDPNFVYRAPEDRGRGELGSRASVYSLGAVLVAALTGKAPPAEVRPQQESASRDLPLTLGSVIARAMSPDPARRYANAIELARAAIEAVQASERLDRAKPVRVVAWTRQAEARPKAALTLTPRPSPAEPEENAAPAPDEVARAAATAAKREAAQTAERDRRAAEAAERARKRAEAAKREAAKRAEQERKAAEAADREAKKRAEQERKAAEAADREAAKLAEQERKAEEAAERQAAKRAERERKAAEAAARKRAREDARAAAARRRSAERSPEDRRAAAEGGRRKRGRPAASAAGAARSDRDQSSKPATRTKRSRPKAAPTRPKPSRPATRSTARRGTQHRKPAKRQPQKRNNAASPTYGSPRRSNGRLPVIFAAAAVGIVAAGTGALALATGGDSGAAAATVSNGELSLRLPAGWKRIDHTDARFGSLSTSLTAAQPDDDHSVLLTGAMVEPTQTTAAIRRLAPRGTKPVPTRLGQLEVTRYDGLRTRPDMVGAAYVLNTTGPSVLIVCEAPRAASAHPLRQCAEVASTLRLTDELPLSLASAKARRPQAYSALRELGAARVTARARIADATLAADQADAAGDLQVDYYVASRRVEATGLPGASIEELVAALSTTGDAYGSLADAIRHGDQAAYDRARATVLHREADVWRLLPQRASQTVGAQP